MAKKQLLPPESIPEQFLIADRCGAAGEERQGDIRDAEGASSKSESALHIWLCGACDWEPGSAWARRGVPAKAIQP